MYVYRPKPKKLALVSGPVSKALTSAEADDRDNHLTPSTCVTPVMKSSSTCVTPVMKSESKLANVKCEAGDVLLHRDIVSSSNDNNLQR